LILARRVQQRVQQRSSLLALMFLRSHALAQFLNKLIAVAAIALNISPQAREILLILRKHLRKMFVGRPFEGFMCPTERLHRLENAARIVGEFGIQLLPLERRIALRLSHARLNQPQFAPEIFAHAQRHFVIRRHAIFCRLLPDLVFARVRVEKCAHRLVGLVEARLFATHLLLHQCRARL